MFCVCHNWFVLAACGRFDFNIYTKIKLHHFFNYQYLLFLYLYLFFFNFIIFCCLGLRLAADNASDGLDRLVYDLYSTAAPVPNRIGNIQIRINFYFFDAQIILFLQLFCNLNFLGKRHFNRKFRCKKVAEIKFVRFQKHPICNFFDELLGSSLVQTFRPADQQPDFYADKYQVQESKIFLLEQANQKLAQKCDRLQLQILTRQLLDEAEIIPSKLFSNIFF